ncbi:hypothetical protein C6P45_004767 [Maudiozyma exigua]|uniref:LIM zinc-binding domain-containing protein n=1 Tax=Maudiozyma exigua TaxID=34358 RepID=A0A9P6WF90_MAUEX|nr:hypothetical protein C6P45_004767 [Kazachstania exigua]
MGLLKTTSHSDRQFEKLRKTGFHFNYKQIIKKTVVQPKKFSGYFDFECPDEIEVESVDDSNDNDIFQLPEQTKLRPNMSSIIVLDNNNIENNQISMHENNIFFNVDDTTSQYQNINETDPDDSLMEYVTADDHTPVATKGTLVDLSKCILREGSPLNRKQKVVVDGIVPLLVEAQDVEANSTIANNPLTEILDIRNPQADTTLHVQLQDIHGKYLDSTESFTDLSQSTILKEGVYSDISSQDCSSSSPCENDSSNDFVWPMGEGPCRHCQGTVYNYDRNGEKVAKALRAIFAEELHGQWHRSCFQCKDCCVTLDQSNECYVYEDEPYCRFHYHVHNNSLCHICTKIIEGECLQNHKEERFHIDCMKCYVCNQTIQTDYTLINDTVTICKEHNLETLAQQGLIEM